MKYLIVGDIHLSDKAPSSCTDEYCDDLFTILEHTIQLELSLDVDGVIWAGDVFHVKQANRNSHRLVQRAIDIVQAYKKLWIVPGNHDLSNNRFESLYETQPLGTLLKAGAELLNGWEATGGHPIYGVPWRSEWTPEVVTEAFVSWHWRKNNRSDNFSTSLVVAHAPLYPPSLELPWEYFETELWSQIQETGYCYYGHVHEAHGTYQVKTAVSDVMFCNQGAITRGSLHESDLQRKVAVTTWAPDEGFTRVEVPHKPADAVFRLIEKRAEQDKKADLTEFLESVGEAQIEITSIESVVAHLRTLDLPDDVLRLAQELLSNSS